MKKTISLLAIGFAAGCSGGGGSDKVYEPFDGTGQSTLASTSSGTEVSIDRDTNTLTFNGEEGQINAAGDAVTFPSGASMSLQGTDNEYTRLFVLSGADSVIGTFGIDTDSRDIPPGSASYSGETVLSVSAPEGLFDLTGDANASVNFGTEKASVTLDNLSGTQSTGVSAPTSVDDFGSVQISDIDLDGNGLSGGDTVVMTDDSASFAGTITGGVTGLFYGPNAEEIGGSVDLTGENAAIAGAFVGAQ